jgi:hypothetical protein
MADVEIDQLLAAARSEGGNLTSPGHSLLGYVQALDIGDRDLQALLGDAPGFTWTDVKENVEGFFARVRRRVARLVCSDDELRGEVTTAIKVGAEATWIAVVAAVGVVPGSVAAAALKPIAVALVVSGVGQLCSRAPTQANDE